MNPLITTLACISLVLLIVSVACYIHTTNSIINSKDATIRRLIVENKSLREKVNVSKRTVEIHDNRVDSANIPDYDQKW